MHKLIELLAWDTIAKRHGCGLNPRLRAAIVADVRFPARAASPLPRHPIDPDTLPAEVSALSTKRSKFKRKKA